MRISILAREYRGVSPYAGGIGTFFALLAPALVERGHEVDVLTVAPDGAAFDREIDGVRVHAHPWRLRGRLWPVDDLYWSYVADRFLRRRARADVVFAAEWGADAWRYSRRRRSAPVVTNLTTSLEQVLAISPPQRLTPLTRLRYVLQRRLERSQTEASSGLVACSNAILEWTDRLWEIREIPAVVIPNFVDVRALRQAAHEGELPEGWPQEGPVVLFFGRLELRKGIDVLAAAMPEVWAEHSDCNLVALGAARTEDGVAMDDRVKAAAGEAGGRLHLLGPQGPERLFAAVARAEVVVFPSRWENLSLATLEARALGRPVVYTTGSGFDDIFRDEADGLGVPPEDSGALARAISRLLDDEALRCGLGDAAARAEDDRRTTVVGAFHQFFLSAVAP